MQQLTAHGSSKVVQVAHVVEDVDLAIVQRRLDPLLGVKDRPIQTPQ
jgi:hypothetical protein